MASPSFLEGAAATSPLIGGTTSSVATAQAYQRWIPFRAEMWPPGGAEAGGRNLNAVLSVKDVVAAMISGISRTLQPGEEGGGDWVGAGCGQLPPHPLAMVSLTTKYQYCSSSRLTPANSTRKSGAPNKNTPPGGQTIITF